VINNGSTFRGTGWDAPGGGVDDDEAVEAEAAGGNADGGVPPGTKLEPARPTHSSGFPRGKITPEFGASPG